MAVAELAGTVAEDFGAVADEDWTAAELAGVTAEDFGVDAEEFGTVAEDFGAAADDDWSAAEELAALAEELATFAEELKGNFTDEELTDLAEEEPVSNFPTDELDLLLEVEDLKKSPGVMEVLESATARVFVPESSEHAETAKNSAAIEAHFTIEDVFNKLRFMVRPAFFCNITIDWIHRVARDDVFAVFVTLAVRPP